MVSGEEKAMSKVKIIGIAAIFFLIMFCMKTEKVWADEEKTGVEKAPVTMEEEEGKEPFIVVERYELSHERIIPGNGFTLTLHIKNLSDTRSARQVLLDIANPKGVAPVYGTVSQVYIGDLRPGESRAISFDYDSWTSIASETLDFNVTLVSDGNMNGVVLRMPAGIESIFYVMATNGPNTVYVGDNASVSLNFRVLGDENVSDVVLRMDINGETVATSQVGNLSAGTTKTQSISFKPTKTGKYTADFYLEYVGADGQSESEFIATKVLEVKAIEKEEPDVSLPGDEIEDEVDNTKTMMLVLSGALILAIFIVSAVIMKRKR